MDGQRHRADDVSASRPTLPKVADTPRVIIGTHEIGPDARIVLMNALRRGRVGVGRALSNLCAER